MRASEYFAQGDWYFSESSGEQIPLENMAQPHLLNAMRKLLNSENLFHGSVLHKAMVRRLRPEPHECVEILQKHGSVSYWIGAEFPGMWDAARAMLYRVGKRAGQKVSTHKEGEFLKAFIPEPPIRVRAH